MSKPLLPMKQELNHPKVVRRAEVLKRIERKREELELQKELDKCK